MNKLLLILTVILFSMSGCSAIKGAVASLKSTDHFITLETDHRVLYEPDSKNFAQVLAQYLPNAIEQVEIRQYRKFSSPVLIYVCSSHDSFYKFTGQGARATLVSGKAFFSPRLLETPENVSKILTHELSHLHIEQQLGILKMAKLPFWLKEGLATFVSGGGGTGKVTEREAAKAIISGKHFLPHENGGLFIRKTPSYWSLTPHMYYRQSMMFVSFLQLKDHTNFRKLVLEIQDGNGFADSYRNVYGNQVAEEWGVFLKIIKEKG